MDHAPGVYLSSLNVNTSFIEEVISIEEKLTKEPALELLNLRVTDPYTKDSIAATTQKTISYEIDKFSKQQLVDTITDTREQDQRSRVSHHQLIS